MARTPVIDPRPTFGSLFSGGGFLDLGLERAGWRVAWQSEVDPYASSVLRKHWPHVPNIGDVRGIAPEGVDPAALSHLRVELLAGGFPCQDLSGAGKRFGLDGARSGLWAEFAAIIGALRPKFVLIENVARLRSAGLDRVLGDLSERGYDAEWDILSAASVGAPHLRERIWIVAWDTARVRVPDPFGLGLREQRQRHGEQHREPRADEPRDDGAQQRLAVGHRGRREVERAPHDDDRGHAPGDVAHGRGADVADAVPTGREGESSGGAREPARRPTAPGRGGAVPYAAGFRVFDPAAYAEHAARCAREVWPRAAWEAGIEPGLGRAADGDPGRLDARPADPWERDTPRSLDPAEAAERRLRGEVRSARLSVIGNGVVPQIVEFIGQRIQILRTFSVDS